MSALKSPLAKTVYKIAGGTLALAGVGVFSYYRGKSAGRKERYDEGYNEGQRNLYGDITNVSALGANKNGTVTVAGEQKRVETGNDATWIHFPQ